MPLATGEVAARMHADMHRLAPPKPGETPLDFVNRLKAEKGVANMPTPVSVEGVIKDVQAKIGGPNVSVVPSQEAATIIAPAKDPEPVFGFDKKPETPTVPQQTAADPEEIVPEELAPLKQSYQNLLKKHKETKKTYIETLKAKEEFETKVKDYEAGAMVPEVLQQKDHEIQRLSAYEKLFNFKGSKAYKEQIAEPLTNTRNEIKKYFTEYGIPENVIEKAESFTSRADRNRFLSDHFDIVGAQEVGQLLDKSANLRTKAVDIEKEPSRFMNEMEAEHARISEAKEFQRKELIGAKAKDAWAKAVMKIRADGKFKELIPKINDDEYNKKFVFPLMTQAAGEYGKIVTKLAEKGITELDDDTATYFAMMSLYAHSSVVAAETRDAAIKEANAATAGTKIGNGYFRPAIGGGVPSMGSSAPAAPARPTLEQGVNSLLNNVLQKRA